MTMTTTGCVREKNKKIFATRAEAEDFEKRNRETYGNPQQYAYDCPHGNHIHLSSSPSYVAGAPQVRTTDWTKAKIGWQVVDPELPSMSRGDKILAALRRHNGNKTVKEIAAECGVANNQLPLIYDIAKEHDLPYRAKRSYGRMATETPVMTLQSVQSRREQMKAEYKRLDEIEKEIRQREEEKRRVTVKVASNGTNGNATMIFAGASGNGLWLTEEQANSLLVQLPGVIEEMQARQEASAGAAAGEQ
jgi:hypothetical protein